MSSYTDPKSPPADSLIHRSVKAIFFFFDLASPRTNIVSSCSHPSSVPLGGTHDVHFLSAIGAEKQAHLGTAKL